MQTAQAHGISQDISTSTCRTAPAVSDSESDSGPSQPTSTCQSPLPLVGPPKKSFRPTVTSQGCSSELDSSGEREGYKQNGNLPETPNAHTAKHFQTGQALRTTATNSSARSDPRSSHSESSVSSDSSWKKGKLRVTSTMKGMKASVSNTTKKAVKSLTAFFPKISRNEWEKQEKGAWAALAEDRTRCREEEERERERKAAEKREFDKLRQRDYRATKRAAAELTKDDEDTEQTGNAKVSRIEIFGYAVGSVTVR